MTKNSFFSSVVRQKCPKCRTGNLFVHGSYNLKKFTEMNEKCGHCSQTFHLEPSFYIGAMYVSYAINVALFVTISIAISILFPGTDLLWYFAAIVTTVLLLYPLLLRLSRSLWIHFFVKYDNEIERST